MSDNTWKTAISDIKPNEVRLRGYRIDELMGRVDFGQAFYLLLRGELPDERVGRLMTAILVSSMDHGPGGTVGTGRPDGRGHGRTAERLCGCRRPARQPFARRGY